jgi:hypothetical protein
MPEPASRRGSGPDRAPWIVIGMLAMLAVPAGVALNTVRSPGKLQVSVDNPTPQGYTWSLLLFVIPALVIAVWLTPRERLRFPRHAFLWTLAILTPLGFALDFFFADTFFVFQNSGATLGIQAPTIHKTVPIEEYAFYFTGFVAVLLLYVWLGEAWLAAYTEPAYDEHSKRVRRLLQFHPRSAAAGLVLIAAAIAYRKLLSAEPQGFPAYFTVLVVGGLLPATGFFESVQPVINWRAFSLTVFFIVLVSVIWEATLAVPYGWWGYQADAMLGVSVGAWSGLPIEAVCVWIAVTYATVIVFEVVKLWLASERRAGDVLLGRSGRGPSIAPRNRQTTRAIG